MYHFISPRSGGAGGAPSPRSGGAPPFPPWSPWADPAPAPVLFGAAPAIMSAMLRSRTFVPLAPCPTLAIDQLRQVRPYEVEHAEDDRRDDRHDDDNERRGADFLGGRPRHLLELARY